MKLWWGLCAALAVGNAASGAEIADPALIAARGAQMILLGETHDNPWHHQNQAAAVAAIAPAALVFEMLTPEQAGIANATERSEAGAMATALDWDKSGWPDFAMYHPIFLAAPQARIYGAAVPYDDLKAAMSDGAAAAFGDQAERFGLAPLAAEDQAAREAEQMEAHCNALPEEMLPGMVEAQRLRDARFSEVALQALAETGGPVVVITGNGHAQRDTGMPAYLAVAAPDLRLLSLGQFEAPPQDPGSVPFDDWIVTAPAEREDPCANFAPR
ncbi:ChaN family lipoprotein [Tropicimonas sp. IMCC34043]|uniref:ChaN family lipoprotein n=1 Tax=Tropicimonas sp. IMCC34043 TaxID=2248760 RepID=UPI000E251BCB|nr:ChaN family lipoprotein [Tropicimonas sp. IMCC34043]